MIYPKSKKCLRSQYYRWMKETEEKRVSGFDTVIDFFETIGALDENFVNGFLQQIEIGDVCKYQESDKLFIVTDIRIGQNGCGELEGFFDAICEDGTVCYDGSVKLLEYVGSSGCFMSDLRCAFKRVGRE